MKKFFIVLILVLVCVSALSANELFDEIKNNEIVNNVCDVIVNITNAVIDFFKNLDFSNFTNLFHKETAI